MEFRFGGDGKERQGSESPDGKTAVSSGGLASVCDRHFSLRSESSPHSGSTTRSYRAKRSCTFVPSTDRALPTAERPSRAGNATGDPHTASPRRWCRRRRPQSSREASSESNPSSSIPRVSSERRALQSEYICDSETMRVKAVSRKGSTDHVTNVGGATDR